jgi:hypothetical protein
MRAVCDLLDEHNDASHVAVIVRQGVKAGLLDLNVLIERVGPDARRYGVRAHDGHALLDHLLGARPSSTRRFLRSSDMPPTAAPNPEAWIICLLVSFPMPRPPTSSATNLRPQRIPQTKRLPGPIWS